MASASNHLYDRNSPSAATQLGRRRPVFTKAHKDCNEGLLGDGSARMHEPHFQKTR